MVITLYVKVGKPHASFIRRVSHAGEIDNSLFGVKLVRVLGTEMFRD